VEKRRPIYLNLTTMKFPPAAIASILHRISGVVILLLIPLVLWALQLSLTSLKDFAKLQSFFSSFSIKLLAWVFLTGLLYHICAGIRHMVMDLGYAESLKAGKITAYVVIGIGIILAVLVGVWLW